MIPLLVASVLAGACGYETSGTTTTTEAVIAHTSPATSPSAISISDQRIEGSSVVVDSVTLPAPGFVVAREDDGGSPGAVLGVSELLPIGIVQQVTVPFDIPIVEPMVVHVTVQIDVDEDGRFSYEPPDFIDAIATLAGGEPASASAELTLLAPLGPADAVVEEQTTDGTTLTVASATLPGPGFVAVQRNEAQQPGEVLAITGLLAGGTVTDLAFELDPPLRTTQLVYAVAYVDRNENGVFDPGDGADEMGVRDDGTLAIGSAVITTLVREPGSVTVADQESEGDTVVIDAVTFPSAGFVEILADDAGEPGARVGISGLRQAGEANDITVTLDVSLTDDATLWVRVWIDFDESGTLSLADLVALTERDGDPVEASFAVTLKEP